MNLSLSMKLYVNIVEFVIVSVTWWLVKASHSLANKVSLSRNSPSPPPVQLNAYNSRQIQRYFPLEWNTYFECERLVNSDDEDGDLDEVQVSDDE
jgi:hypothetical protein